MRYVYGVDIGSTAIKMGLFQEDGSLLESWKVPTRTINGGQLVLPDVSGAVAKKSDEKNISRDDILGIGVAVPGPVTRDGVVHKAPCLGWGIFNVESTLGGLAGLPVKAINEADAAALGEQWKGIGGRYRDAVVLDLGSRIGSGVFIDGKLVRGRFGAAGEIGHIQVNAAESAECGCGNKGCLEQYCSGRNFALRVKEYLEARPGIPTGLRPGDDSKAICDAAKDRDAVAMACLEEWGALMGKALAAVSAVLDPEAYIIGGGMSRAGASLLDIVRKHYSNSAFHASRETIFELAKLGNDAGIYGAARLIIEK